MSRACVAAACLACVGGAASAHSGAFVIYRNAANELRVQYQWPIPTFLDEPLPPYRGDALNIEIEPLFIPNVLLDMYPVAQTAQIYFEVVDAMPKIVYRDGDNLSRIIGTGANAYYCGTGPTLWGADVWVHADQFHPGFNWFPPTLEWWVDVRVYDATNTHQASGIYRMKIALENFCPADFTHGATPGEPGYGEPDQNVNSDDFFMYLTLYAQGSWRADLTTSATPGAPGYGEQDFLVTSDDFFYYLTQYIAGCNF